MSRMPAEIVDGRFLDADAAEELAAVASAVTAADAPHEEPQPAEYLRLKLKHGWDDRGTEHVVLGRIGGRLVAWASVELPVWDNPQLAFVELAIAPSARDSDIGDQILDEVYSLMRTHHRTLLIANAEQDSSLERFWLGHGLAMGSLSAQRRLLTADLDWPRLDALYANSLTASADYDVFEVRHPVDDDLVDGMLRLQLAMNDAPVDGLAIEDDAWSVERFRGFESAMRHRRITSHRVVARHRATGDLAGFTAVAVEDERKHLGFQEDTAVVAEHRGRRLGLRLKIEMLRLLRDQEPATARVDTWNAVSNTHMIAVNEAIGCFVVGLGVELERNLAI
jgi:GNAT superfamily N-acetyltransferase